MVETQESTKIVERNESYESYELSWRIRYFTLYIERCNASYGIRFDVRLQDEA